VYCDADRLSAIRGLGSISGICVSRAMPTAFKISMLRPSLILETTACPDRVVISAILSKNNHNNFQNYQIRLIFNTKYFDKIILELEKKNIIYTIKNNHIIVYNDTYNNLLTEFYVLKKLFKKYQ
jgi:hypothetical protein